MAFIPRVFSGIQPSGDLHLGNYLGAIKRFVPLQQQYECIYCVVDEHAITVWQEPDDLRRKTREVAAAYVAAGVDPKNHIIFNQSRVHQHAELAWVFNCVARMGWMNRMTQWKDKTAGKNAEAESLGLFAYPSLMAADILLYKATHVPVGDDQKQHLELTRDIAAKFNNDFGKSIKEQKLDADYFPITEPVITGPATRVMSLKDASKKMSKSDASPAASVLLMDDEDTISKKFKRATTDADALPSEEKGLEGRAEADNLVGIYAALAETSKEVVLRDFGNAPFSKFKEQLAELAATQLVPICSEMKRLMADPVEIDRILDDGANRAHAIADPILAMTKDIVGFIRS
jgi:tryptophanyl-tRNA synthetase